MSVKVKSVGMAAYVAVGTSTTFTQLCTMDVSGGGTEASLQELEPCLNETEIEQIVDLPKDLPVTVVYKRLVGSSATLSDTLRGLAGTTTTLKLATKYPLTVPVYERQDFNVISHVNDPPSRPNYLTCTMTIIPIGDITLSTTEPATS